MRRREFPRLVESLPKLSSHQLRQRLCAVAAHRGHGVRGAPGPEGRALPAQLGRAHPTVGRTASGEQRYRCTSCCRSFTGLTGTALNRLRGTSLLLEYAECMRRGLSVRKTAKRLNIHPAGAFEWRHRLMPHRAAHQSTGLPGVAEVDETFFP